MAPLPDAEERAPSEAWGRRAAPALVAAAGALAEPAAAGAVAGRSGRAGEHQMAQAEPWRAAEAGMGWVESPGVAWQMGSSSRLLGCHKRVSYICAGAQRTAANTEETGLPLELSRRARGPESQTHLP